MKTLKIMKKRTKKCKNVLKKYKKRKLYTGVS